VLVDTRMLRARNVLRNSTVVLKLVTRRAWLLDENGRYYARGKT